MTDRCNAHVSLVLKITDWPRVDQEAWDALIHTGGIFDEQGAFAHLSDGSRKKRQQGYGQWLSYLARTSPEKLELAPSARVSIETMRGYLEDCEARLNPRSVLNLITDLFVITRGLQPEADWSWLHRLTVRLQHKADTHALKPRAAMSASEIFDWSLARMEEVEGKNDLSDLRRAIWFRQALMIGFLISRPVRRRALLAMTVDNHLRAVADGYMLTFCPEDMKNGRRYSCPLPSRLVGPMRLYLETHRPVLLNEKRSEFLWISQYGDPITPDGFSRELPKVTLRHLGLELRPHRFRDIAATSIAEIDPEHVGIIRDLLGHATLDMADKHYNRATGISSCNELQSIVEDIRKDMPRMGRAKRVLTPRPPVSDPE